MKRGITTIALVLALIGPTSCASIVNGSKQKVKLESSPTEADFAIYNKRGEKVAEGQTPSEVKLRRGAGYFKKAQYTVCFEAEDCEPQDVAIEAKASGWYVGNLFFGGLIGLLAVDPATGGMWALAPNTIDANMENQGLLLESAEEPSAGLESTSEAGLSGNGDVGSGQGQE